MRNLLFACTVTLTLLLPFLADADQHWLDEERIRMSTNGTAIATTKPLAPYIVYHLTVRSPYDLRKLTHHQFLRGHRWHLRFDAEELEPISPTSGNAYGEKLTEAIFTFRGRGDVLTITTTADHSATIPWLDITLAPEPTISRWSREFFRHGPPLWGKIVFSGLLALVIAAVLFFAITYESPERETTPEHESRKHQKRRPGAARNPYQRSLPSYSTRVKEPQPMIRFVEERTRETQTLEAKISIQLERVHQGMEWNWADRKATITERVEMYRRTNKLKEKLLREHPREFHPVIEQAFKDFLPDQGGERHEEPGPEPEVY